jgi:UDP-N-acetylglucosamine--N-acetylmuramyl-(pentapeptide) pyrophosphoryl-undecaprenol N-acetylglucosamine transferase
MTNNKTKKIILSGGGTAGPVMPLLALHQQLLQDQPSSFDFLWVGTYDGPERSMIESSGIAFRSIPAGKLRRYLSWRNFTDIFRVAAGFISAFKLVHAEKPDLIVSAGAFVSVPLVWAGWLKRVPILIHQQDARPGLANRLSAPFASSISVTFQPSLKHFGSKAVWTGNPVRREIMEYHIAVNEAIQKMGLRGDKRRIVLIMGGGTGALAINQLVAKALPRLTEFCQIIHITGRKKGNIPELEQAELENRNYKRFDFLQTDGLIKAYTVADIVVSRCGLGTLTELAYLGKPSILIPMPGTHQEDNADLFAREEAALVADQRELDAKSFAGLVSGLVHNPEKREKLSRNIRKVMQSNANEAMAGVVRSLLGS